MTCMHAEALLKAMPPVWCQPELSLFAEAPLQATPQVWCPCELSMHAVRVAFPMLLRYSTQFRLYLHLLPPRAHSLHMSEIIERSDNVATLRIGVLMI